MRLGLVRHGQTAWNLQQLAQGHTDTPLDETGLAQARAIASAVRTAWHDGPSPNFISSDLQRAAVTAKIMASFWPEATLSITPELRERCFIPFEGRPWREMRDWIYAESERTGVPVEDIRSEGGESIRDVFGRVSRVADELADHSGPVIVVSHGVALSLFLTRCLRAPVEVHRSFRFGNATLTELVRESTGLMLMTRWNEAAERVAGKGQP